MSSTCFHKISLILAYCFHGYLFSQSGIEPQKMKQFSITINFDEYTVKTQMLSQNKNVCVSNEKLYMWYGSQKIIETKGGYDGRLIHGNYRSFYLNNQLKEQGQICYGLRNKQWKYWYPDGKLKEVIHWKNGVKSGIYLLYNDYGQLMAKGKFKKDKLHGNFYTYAASGKVADKKKYKRGDEKIPKVKVKRPEKEKVLAPKKESNENEVSTEKEKKIEKKKSEKEKKPFLNGLFKRKRKEVEPAKTKKAAKKIKTKSEKKPEKKADRKSVTT